MTQAVRVVGAALGLLMVVLAAPVGSARAQSDDFTPPAECSDPAPPRQENGISVVVTSPTGTDPRTSPTVPVEATFTNESRRPFVNQTNGQITEMRAVVLACAPGQVAPTAPAPVDPPGEPRTATFAWSAEFPTNGRFAVVFEANGTSTGPEGTQTARVVVPVQLAVPAKKPTNVSAADPVNGIVKVTWDYADPEADLVGFQIRRAKQGTGDYVTIRNGIVDARSRSVSDAPPAGAWRYQVVAFREGVPEGSVSRDDTVEVPEPAPAADTTGGATGSAPSSGGGGASGDGPTTTSAGSSVGSPDTPRASVDLSQFAAALNARRTSPTLRVEPPDPGFQETLPFDALGGDDVEGAPAEVGADEPNVGLGQALASDPSERQRSLGFVAFGLLLFVLSMTGLFVKSEVKRADLLDGDLDAVEHAPVAASVPAIAVTAAAAVRRPRRRRARATEPLEAPPQPDEVAPAEPVTLPPLNGSVMAIPETRRRWSQARAAIRPNGTPSVPTEAYHDFDDLALDEHDAPDDGPVALRRRRVRAATHTGTNGQAPPPLDAPGLDVPDPGPPAARPRSRASAPRPPLPTRVKANSRRR